MVYNTEQLKESIRKSNIQFGRNEKPTYISVAAESFVPHVIHPADISAHKHNAAFLRKSNIHLAQHDALDPYLTDRQSSISKAAYTLGAITGDADGGSAGRDADRQKQDLESTHFVLGYHTSTPRVYQSVAKGYQEAMCKALLSASGDTVVGTTEEQEASIKREPSISFGTDVPTYKSTSAAALVDHTKGGSTSTGADPRAARECAARLRMSNFSLAGYSKRPPEYDTTTATAHNWKAHHLAVAQGGKETSSVGADVKRRNYKANFHLGSDRPLYTTETAQQYSTNYQELVEACKHPRAISQAEKDDLRRQHFVFGMRHCDEDARKERMESISAAAYKDHTNSMVAGNAREEMLRLKAELRKPNFSLASLSQSSAGLGVPRSVARATYTQPPVSAYLEGADPNVRQERKNELESAHFVFGVGREEDLRNLRSSSVANTSYGPIPAHAYAQRGLDPHLQADLRSHHFELGVPGGVMGTAAGRLPTTTSRDAYRRHDDTKPARMPEDVRKDLRASHFHLGPKTANPQNWLTTQAQSMVPHPPQSNELDKALKADLRASHFSIGALGDAEKARSITRTSYVWPELNLDVATCSAAEGT